MSKVDIKFNENPKAPDAGADVSILSREIAEKVRRFHSTFDTYAPTPLARLTHLADHLGLGEILVKDESYRFNLNAFKVLGGTYAVGKLLAQKLGKEIDEVSCNELRSEETRKAVGDITFASTTDGNHGRGLAWAAQQFDQKAIIYMPKGSDPIRRDNIRALGAECTISELYYDDCVRMAWDTAQKNGWLTVQDTSWEGYEEIPTSIMQGYTTLALEALEQMQAMGVNRPTHVLLQAGVGCFAGAMLGFFMSVFGKDAPTFIIVEPEAANCFYVSACENDGNPHAVTGSLATLMAGLACGEPNITSWEMLRDYPLAYASCSDDIAAKGMRILGAPMKGDPQVISGESGAATTGFLQWVMQEEEGREAREKLGLTKDAKVLCINTEGDTSPETYRDVVWFGRDN
ncbi:diaminopropionate ammonia-lyase [Desulfoluna butyratoxydans]|uniref:Diaminopropionate ammonia-lyase subgroup n=1 Tax=Desulfoluna butyratoxydans TaxID=231438 RepID=A0A4U8YRY6_9BACT|nr:diaminopropionate ammonia-lyase [Desulfoluna butyratoxydans]VFQ44562.1 diaminopropionate ammonia-lyase subgroup [Desulfoluna butyratoxydans]